MLDLKTYIYGKLSAAGLGATVIDYEPQIKTTFPLVILSESNQTDVEFADDYPTAIDAQFVVDVYTKNESAVSIAILVCDVFRTLTWACVANRDVPDPTPDVRHRHLEFRRSLVPSELV